LTRRRPALVVLLLLGLSSVAVPVAAQRRQAGGMIRFQRLQTGAWLPIEWRLRAPLPSAR